MMSVHISPGYNAANWSPDTIMHWVGALWVDVLGRSSVPTLSVISGFLIALQFGGEPFKDFAWKRFKVLYVPMLFWNFILATMVFLPASLFDLETRNYQLFFDAPLATVIFENFLFLYGHPANVPIAFMRDLFICSLIAFLLLRYAHWAIIPTLILSIFLWQTNAYGEVILRPSILTFVMAGVMLQSYVGHLTPPIYLRPLFFGLLFIVIGHFWFGYLMPIEAILPSESWQFMLRLIVTVCMLDFAGVVSRSNMFDWLKPNEPVAYLSYLSHSVIILTIWEGLERVIGGVDSPFYIIFFLTMPPLVFIATRWASPVIDKVPRWLQIMTRGKATDRNEKTVGTQAVDVTK